MVRRSAATLVILALLMLAAASGGRSQERPLAPAELQQKAFRAGACASSCNSRQRRQACACSVSPSCSAPGAGTALGPLAVPSLAGGASVTVTGSPRPPASH